MRKCMCICKEYKVPRVVGKNMYAKGVKRCVYCEMYLSWEGLYCPCCGSHLRLKPRSRKNKSTREVKTI